MNRHRALKTMLLLCCIGAACSNQNAAVDAAVDADASVVVDLAPDRPVDQAPEAAEQGGDIALDGRYDVEIDSLATDATLSPGTVLYAVGANPDEFGLRTVAADGTTMPTVVSGFGGLIDFDALKLAALLDQPALSPELPRPTPEGPFAGIKLPNNKGTLYYFHRKVTGTSGLLAVRPDGSQQVVLEVFGLYVDVLGEHIALALDGDVGLAVHGSDLLLFRTDGTALPGGKPWMALGFSNSPPATIHDRSLTVAGNWAFCVVSDDMGARQLLRAPTDGSTALEPVTLPAGASGGELTFVDEAIAMDRVGSRLAIVAGTGASPTDVLAVDVATGKANRLNELSGNIALRGERFGGLTAQLAVSPQGTRVAYVVQQQGIEELFVVDAAGPPDAAVQVTDPSRFQSSVQKVVNLRFVDEDNLLFMAGVTGVQLDIFRYAATTKQATNLTGIDVVPFGGNGLFEPDGGWAGSTRAFFWVQDAVTGMRTLLGVDLQSFTTTEIYSVNGLVKIDGGDFAVCDDPSAGAVFFIVQLAMNLQREIWGFDALALTPAVKVAGAPDTGPWTTDGPMVSPDCSQLFFTAGGIEELRILWRAPVVAGSVDALTTVPRSFSSSYGLTMDGQTIVYASGGDQNKTTLRAAPIGGSPTVLDPTAGAVHIFTVF